MRRGLVSLTLTLLSLPAAAGVRPANLIAVHSPRGVRVVDVSTPARNAAEVAAELRPATPPFTFRHGFARVGSPVAEQSLPARYRAESDLIIRAFVRAAVALLRLNHLDLDPARATPVSYEVGPRHRPGRTTLGMIDACWECYGAAGNREYVAYHLGLDVGSLENVVSLNPRFTRQLFRGAAAGYTFTFQLRDHAPTTVEVFVELAESYLPFVADVLGEAKEPFGHRVIGAGQRLRLNVDAALDPQVFGVPALAWTPLDLFNVVTTELGDYVPATFVDVVEHAAPDQAQRGFVTRAVADLNEYLRAFGMLTRESLKLPGKPSWFE